MFLYETKCKCHVCKQLYIFRLFSSIQRVHEMHKEKKERKEFLDVSRIHIPFYIREKSPRTPKLRNDESSASAGDGPGHRTNYYDTLRQQQHSSIV